MSGLPARDPDVLLCTEMTLTIDGGRVRLNYDHGASETLREGEYRGRTTRVSRRKIEESYKTTERAVRKTWELRKDGTLLVSVRIKYHGDKAQTYQRVFDPSANTTPTDKRTKLLALRRNRPPLCQVLNHIKSNIVSR